MPYAGFAAARARQSNPPSCRGVTGMNEKGYDSIPDAVPGSHAHNAIDLCGDDSDDKTGQEQKLAAVSNDGDDDEVIFVAEMKPPPGITVNISPQAKVRNQLTRMQIERLPEFPREVRYALSPRRLAEATANQQQNDGNVAEEDPFMDRIPAEVSSVSAGTRVDYTPKIATDTEMKDVKLHQKFTEDSKKKIEISARIVNKWLKTGKLKKIPRDFFTLNGGVTEEGCAPFYLGDNTDFVPYDEGLMPARRGCTRYKRDENGHVLAAAYIDDRGDKQYEHPVVYYYHEDGFVIACKLTWAQLCKKKNKIKSGMVEVLGERTAFYKSRTSGVKCVFVRSYSALRPNPDKDNYMRVNLYCEDVSKQYLSFELSNLCLVTFVEPRPEGYIADHCGERCDDSLHNLSWKPRNENIMKVNLHPDPNAAHKTYTLSHLNNDEDEDVDPWNDPNEVWFIFPNDENDDGDEVYVNAKGTHVYNNTKKKYISVQMKTYFTGFVKMLLSIFVGGEQKHKTMDFGRFCLQSFIARKLKDWETCDHGDHKRTNNSYDNLFPRHRLFQGYNKAIHLTGKYPDGSEVGVYKAGNRWVATVRAYTPDGPTRSKEILKSFSITDWGDYGAKQEAVKFRKQFTLSGGMCFDCPERVPPTIVNRIHVKSHGETDESDSKLPSSRKATRKQSTAHKENADPLPNRKRSRKNRSRANPKN